MILVILDALRLPPPIYDIITFLCWFIFNKKCIMTKNLVSSERLIYTLYNMIYGTYFLSILLQKRNVYELHNTLKIAQIGGSRIGLKVPNSSDLLGCWSSCEHNLKITISFVGSMKICYPLVASDDRFSWKTRKGLRARKTR